MVAIPSLRIVFFGTPGFAVPTLEALLRSSHRVVGVVSQPDRPKGRGRHVTFTPVKAAAQSAAVPVLQPEKLKDTGVREALADLATDLGVVAAYGKILPEWLLQMPRLGVINVHASLLPRYRGAAPIQRAVMAGEIETGVTIMRVVKELDAGPMLARVSRPIPPDATSADVERDLGRVGADLLVTIADALAVGGAREEPQDHSLATYAPKITREDSDIDWQRPAEEINNQIRGLTPWPRAAARVAGMRLAIIRAAVEGGEGGDPGVVVGVESGSLRVGTGRGVLRLLEVQPEGRRAMSVREFLAGHSIGAGTRFQ